MEDLVLLKRATFHTKGVYLSPVKIIAWTETMLSVSISGLDAVSYQNNTKNIAEALSPFGEVKDIVFTQWGKVTDSRASVILDMKGDKHLPEKLQIGRNIVDVSSKKMEASK